MASVALASPATDRTSSHVFLSRAEFQKAFPQQYLEKFVAHGVRPDGRAVLEMRPSRVTRGGLVRGGAEVFAHTHHCGGDQEAGLTLFARGFSRTFYSLLCLMRRMHSPIR